MPSSYTQTGIELIATGEQSGDVGFDHEHEPANYRPPNKRRWCDFAFRNNAHADNNGWRTV
jgi:hypothetical protein